MKNKHLRALTAILAMFLLVGTLEAKKNNADKLFKAGQTAEAKGDWDRALELYLQALDLKPSEPPYMIAMRRARFESGQKHVETGLKLSAEGKVAEAMAEFQKALFADPSSPIAVQELKRTQEMLDQKNPAKPDESKLSPVERARQEAEARIESIESPPELKPVLRTVGPLKMNNQPTKVLFETVGKLAGVNVLFDSQYTPPAHGFNVELPASAPEQAFDYLAVLTHTFWKPIASNAIFVAEDNTTKHRDYDDDVVRTFYIHNATSVQEFQEMATAIRTVADIRRVFTYTAQKAMIVRGSQDAVELAEKLVHDLDKPKSEVLIDVIVMQTNSERTRSLAATIASAGTAGLSMSASFLPQTSTSTSTTSTTTTTTTSPGTVTLGQLGHLSINNWSTSLPGAMLNLMMTDNKTKVVNSPQLRCSDGQKASIKIGERYPYATGSFQPGVGTVGVSPLVSTQFNFADIGVNVEITPQVHSSDDLTLHVKVEISDIASTVNLGGISQPVIGQNLNEADIRMRSGEVNIMGGLSQLSDSNQLAGLPGLTDIPILGKFLFGSTNTDRQNNQLLIALIPHILRTPDYTAENLRSIYAGTDQAVKLLYAPRPEEAATPATQTSPEVSAAPAAPAPEAAKTPAIAPANAPVNPSLNPPLNPPLNVPLNPGQARLSFLPAKVEAAVSNTISVNLQVDNANDLASGAPIKVKWDPTYLRLNDIGPGEMLARGGVHVTAVKDIRNDAGEATLTVSRPPDSPGITGAGTIAVLNFVAVGKGTSEVTLVEPMLKNSKQESLSVTTGELPVTVK
ncbi:MAG TPA: cohesin domain-containing protein [Bryobacteraceae bacterium]|nr:cohesin domain-containing protein [Bryobacteraceae bacterium]